MSSSSSPLISPHLIRLFQAEGRLGNQFQTNISEHKTNQTGKSDQQRSSPRHPLIVSLPGFFDKPDLFFCETEVPGQQQPEACVSEEPVWDSWNEGAG